MAIWLEIHCDSYPSNEASQPFHCLTTGGDNPGVLSNSDRQSMMDALWSLEKECLKKGWKKNKKSHWTCPNCLKNYAVPTS